MQIRAFEALLQPLAQPVEVLLAALALAPGHLGLFLDQQAGTVEIARDQHVEGQPHVVHQPLVQRAQLRPALGAEPQALAPLFLSQGHQPLGDNVARAFQIDGIFRQRPDAPAFLLAQRLARDRGGIAADARERLVHVPVHLADRLDALGVVIFVKLHHRAGHDLDDLPHAQHLAGEAGDGERGVVDHLPVERAGRAEGIGALVGQVREQRLERPLEQAHHRQGKGQQQDVEGQVHRDHPLGLGKDVEQR